MKKIDSLGLKMCSYQAALFEASVNKTQCSSAIFIRRFMNSALAKRMDNVGFLFDSTDTADAINEVEAQYGPSSYGVEKYSIEEMHWIGYIYRYWAYTGEKPSREICRLAKPGELRKLYFPYHSLDPAQAIERIIEQTGPGQEHDPGDIAAGVEIMRRVRGRADNKR